MTPGAVVADRYELLRLAGSGAMGAVYKSLDRHSGATVAVKLALNPNESSRQRFIRESRILSEVRHPAIVAHVDHGYTAEGAFYLVMEWLEGMTLDDRLAERGLTMAESVFLVRRLAEGLAVAHAKGIVHRDIKPANVMLAGGELAQCKLLDFGVARRPNATLRLTLEGMPIGTPHYMAPEQARGDSNVDSRADVFALGAVLYECLTGSPPFEGDSLLAILGKVLMAEAVPVEEINEAVPAELARVVGQMLAKDPVERPSDGRAVAEQLDLEGLPEVRAPVGARVVDALTSSERRLASMILIVPDSDWRDVGAETLASSDSGGTIVDIAPDVLREAERHGARVERLIDGSCLLAFLGEGDAASRAWSASRAALELATEGRRVALTTGRSETGRPIGESLERGAALLSLPVVPGGARVDDVTRALLADRAHFGSDDYGPILLAEGHGRVLGRPSPFVGRRRELSVLDAERLECLDEGGARVTLIIGPAGVGKSRLRGEILRRSVADMTVWSASADAVGAGAPLRLVAELVRSAARLREANADTTPRAAIEALVSPPSCELLCHLIGVPIESPGPQLAAALHDPKLMSEQLRRAFIELCVRASAREPLLILIEDLHWGDVGSVRCIDEAIRAADESPLWVVGFARPEVTELLSDPWANRRRTELRLGPLGARDAKRLVEAALPVERRDPEVVERILERASGSPLFIEELVRAVAQGAAEELPGSVLALVEARLEALDPGARRVLRAASLFGGPFWPEAVAALLGESSASEVSRWLDILTEEELIERTEPSRFAGHLELRFHHDIVREASYAMLTGDDRRLGHRLAADWLSKAGERDPLVLAEHFEKGEQTDQAAAALARASKQALEASALERAKELADRGLALQPVMERRAQLWLTKATAHHWLGEYAEARPLYEKALDRLPGGSDDWYAAAIGVANAGQVSGDGESARVVAELIANADLERGRGLEARLRIATMLMSTGHYETGISTTRAVQSAAERRAAAEPALAARLYRALEWIALIEGDPLAGLRALEAACSALTRAGDLLAACGERINVGSTLHELGLYARAESQLRQALAEAQRLDTAGLIGGAYGNLGVAVAHLGRLEEARALQAHAIAECTAIGALRLAAASRVYLAHVLRRLGELALAEREARCAVELVGGIPPFLPYAQATLAEVLADAGRLEEALELGEAAAAKLSELGALEAGEGLVRIVHVRVLAAAGLAERARAAGAEARTWLEARSATIDDLEIRGAYLAIPEHRAILETG